MCAFRDIVLNDRILFVGGEILINNYGQRDKINLGINGDTSKFTRHVTTSD